MVMLEQIWNLAALIGLVGLIRCKAELDSSDNDSSCRSPLGMEHGHIKDEAITASSAFDHKSVGPQNARLNKDHFGGAWCPKSPIGPETDEWLQIDLGREFLITRTGTQGRYGQGRGQEYAEEFQLQFWRSHLGTWVSYNNHTGHEILEGNDNTYLENVNDLNPPIVASKVKFLPHSKHPRTVCMRVELYGCPFTSKIESYKLSRDGDEFSPHVYIEDIYDGDLEKGNGLGQLTDGQLGQRIVFDNHGIKTAHGWVGWMNLKDPVEITFTFDSVRNFHKITFVCYNNPELGIQPLADVLAFLSLGDDKENFGAETHKAADKAVEPPDKIGRTKVTMTFSRTKELVGKLIKLRLVFADKWIFVSEISFVTIKHNAALAPMETTTTSTTSTTTTTSTTILRTTTTSPQLVFDDFSKESKGVDDGETPILSKKITDQVSESDQRLTAQDKREKGSSGHQIYIGLVIGVLGVTVLLLVSTILVMLRRNKQKVFNKQNPMIHFKDFHTAPSRGSTDFGLGMTRSPLGGGKIYEDPNGEAFQRDLHLHQLTPTSIYHEPNYRLVLQRNNNGMTYQRNGSCGRLCDYEEPGILLDQQDKNEGGNVTGRRLPKKNKFGSTPLFLSSPKNQQQPSTFGTPFSVHPSYSCHESLRPGMTTAPWPPMRPNHYHLSNPRILERNHNECFYAATELFEDKQLIRRSQGHDLDLFATTPTEMRLSSGLSKGDVTTMKFPDKTDSTNLDPFGLGDQNLSNVPQISRQDLRIVQKLGEGGFGMIHLCEWEGSTGSTSKLVLVRSLWKGASDGDRDNFLSNASKLASPDLTTCPHLCNLLAVCTIDEPICLVSEVLSRNLVDFLRSRHLEEGHYSNVTTLSQDGSMLFPDDVTVASDDRSEQSLIKNDDNVSDSGVSFSSLLTICSQIASGLAHLEDRNIVHRDVAARNCLISSCGDRVKLCDFAVFRGKFKSDYFKIADNLVTPIRWIPWEVYFEHCYSTKSDVWSFGVTIWEVLTFCADRPFGVLDDRAVIDNMERIRNNRAGPAQTLPMPNHCPKEMVSLLTECWQRNPEDRPTFASLKKSLDSLTHESVMAF